MYLSYKLVQFFSLNHVWWYRILIVVIIIILHGGLENGSF